MRLSVAEVAAMRAADNDGTIVLHWPGSYDVDDKEAIASANVGFDLEKKGLARFVLSDHGFSHFALTPSGHRWLADNP